MKIGIDCDGVLANFNHAFVELTVRVLGKDLYPGPAGTFDIFTWNYPEFFGYTSSDVTKVWDHIKETDNWFFYNCVTLPFVSENLPWLVEEHDVYFITARIPTAGFSVQKQTQLHISELGVQFPTVLVERDKGPISAALKLDAFVDDKIENLIGIDKATEGKTKIFLMNQSHNAEYDVPSHWTRVKGFGEFTSKIQEME